jgi:hypothetical protein
LLLSEFIELTYDPFGVKDLVLVDFGLGGNFAAGDVSLLLS